MTTHTAVEPDETQELETNAADDDAQPSEEDVPQSEDDALAAEYRYDELDEDATEGESETEQEETVEETTDAEPETTLDETAIERATNIGIPRETAEKLFKAGMLDEVADAHASTLATLIGGQQGETQKPEDEKTQQQKEEEPELDPEIYGQEYVDMMNRERAKTKALEERLSQFEAQREAESREKVAQEFDSLVASLPAEYKGFVGDGKLADLKMGSKEWNARRELLQEMNERAQTASGANMTMEQLFKKALPVVFADQQLEIARNEIRGKLKKREGAMTNRPTNRRQTELSGEEKAAATARAWGNKLFGAADED